MKTQTLDTTLHDPYHAPAMETRQYPAKRRLVVDTSPDFLSQVEQAAGYEGLTVSSFVRRVLTLYMRQAADGSTTD